MADDTCNAPDCDDDTAWMHDGYCSNVCMNVGLELAAAALEMSEPGDVYGIDDVPAETVADVRNRNERARERIEAKLEAVDE